MSEYNGPERRLMTEETVALMIANSVATHVEAMEERILKHLDQKLDAFSDVFERHIDEAFPPGPLHRHKDHHQKLIDSAADAKKIKLDIQMWMIRGALGLFFFVIGTLLFIGAKEWLIRELAK